MTESAPFFAIGSNPKIGLDPPGGLDPIFMDHIAIMKKAWGLTPKILSGQKKIESRWYKTKHSPWGQIRVGETVYFKDSGEPVTLKATVKKVLQFGNLTPSKVRELLDQYGKDDGLEIADLEKFWQILKDKKYCLLIFLTEPQAIEPFDIDKRGFGNMAAWITTPDINHLKTKGRIGHIAIPIGMARCTSLITQY